MLCQFCNKNEAAHTFVFQFMNSDHDVRICQECVDKFQQYAGAFAQQYAQGQGIPAQDIVQPAGQPGQSKQRDLGESPFPFDAGDEIRRRRRLNALKARLKDAVAKEQYEQAAWLRDEIKQLEAEEMDYAD